MSENIVPILDLELIQRKANEAATKAIIQATEDFYTGYNSPIKKSVKEQLKKQSLGSWNIDYPKIMNLIQESITKQFNTTTSNLIADSYLPLVANIITGGKKEVSFRDLLQKFIESFELEYKDDWDMDDFELEVSKPSGNYDWLNITLNGLEGKEYSLTLYLDKETNQRYILNMPYRHGNSQIMKIKRDDIEIELPFNKAILDDKFNSFCANLLLHRTRINYNGNEDFEESMFPESSCICH